MRMATLAAPLRTTAAPLLTAAHLLTASVLTAAHLLTASVLTASVLTASVPAQATPLTLYQTDKDPLAVPGTGPVVACGDAGGCDRLAPPPTKPTGLGFTYGLAVSGTVAASNHGSAVGGDISGWIKPDGLPVTVYFDVERFAPIGRQR